MSRQSSHQRKRCSTLHRPQSNRAIFGTRDHNGGTTRSGRGRRRASGWWCGRFATAHGNRCHTLTVRIRQVLWIHLQFHGLRSRILQIPSVDHSHRNIRKQCRNSFESTIQEGILKYLQAFHFAFHIRFGLLAETLRGVPHTPKPILTSRKYLNRSIHLPNGNSRNGSFPVVVVIVVVVVISIVVVVVVVIVLNRGGCFHDFVQGHNVRKFAVISMLAISSGGVGFAGVEQGIWSLATWSTSSSSTTAATSSTTTLVVSTASPAATSTSSSSTTTTAIVVVIPSSKVILVSTKVRHLFIVVVRNSVKFR
mmetsp:Transcript_27458/g.57503  ORF Transcript_27458/g.57503 Transcript_27458/m.57503 type:complete len:309 (-) Transcript_27458:44-970(-)